MSDPSETVTHGPTAGSVSRTETVSDGPTADSGRREWTPRFLDFCVCAIAEIAWIIVLAWATLSKEEVDFPYERWHRVSHLFLSGVVESIFKQSRKSSAWRLTRVDWYLISGVPAPGGVLRAGSCSRLRLAR